MARFTGTWINKVDRKGRVSVPAAFRAALESGPATGAGNGQANGNGASGLRFSLRPNAERCALDGVTEAYLDDVQRRLDAMDLYSPERADLELREFSEAVPLQTDPEGRIVLPRDFAEMAGITEEAAFVGLGSRFQIWSPAAFAAHRAERLAGARGLTLGASRPGGAA